MDENLIRNDPTSEHALLTGRRTKILRALAEQDDAVAKCDSVKTGMQASWTENPLSL